MRTVVITGGGRGIGAAITLAFHEAGDRVVVGSRSDSRIAVALGERALWVRTDVRVPEELQHLANEAVGFGGGIDVWVNCAGYSAWRPLGEADEAFWDDMLDTNLKGTFFGCKVAAAHFEDGGCVVNVSSLAGKRGSADNSVYCASKFGVTGLTQALAKELGPRGIRVNSVCPVYVETEGLLDALEDPHAPSGGSDVKRYLREFARDQAALRRLPSAEEVAVVCLFLASDDASAITGQNINVDCGVLPQ